MQINITLDKFCEALRTAADWHHINNGHDVRVSELSVKIGERINLSQEQLYNLKYAALIHDIGRVGIDNDIMSKPNALIESEYGAIKTHPNIGYNFGSNVSTSKFIICNAFS